MRNYPDLCFHTSIEVLRQWTNSIGAIIQKVKCKLCDKEWTRWRDAGGEDI